MTAQLLHLGWKEYIDLPELGMLGLKVKIDTGARTSALHVAGFEVDGMVVRMALRRHRRPDEVHAEALLAGWVDVRSSTGELEPRPLITTTLRLGDRDVSTRVTLADRTGMLFRMLIGRKTLEAAGAVVDVSQRYLLGPRGGRR